MEFYKGQVGPVLDTKAYASALRELAKQSNLCSPTFTKKPVTQAQVQQAIAKMPDDKLVQIVQVAAQISEIGVTSEATAEEWFLKQLGF